MKKIGDVMKKIFFISILITSLLAQNPKIYAALGDTIYNNINKIAKLQEIPSFSQYTTKIKQYILDVKKTKQLGNSIMYEDTNNEKAEYLKQLRKLSIINDFFIRNVTITFELAIKSEDSKLFYKLINSGLLDTDYYKKEIIDYYLAHNDEIKSSGIIQNFLEEDAKLIKERDKRIKRTLHKKEIQEAKIKRIREKDLKEHEAIKKLLEEDVARKKADIIKEQKRELGN